MVCEMDLRLLSAGITRNIHLEAENGALREFVEQLQSRVGELQERIVELQERIVEVDARLGATPTTPRCRPRVMMPQRARSESTGPLVAAPPGKPSVASRESNRVIREPIWPRSLIPTMLFPTSRPIAGSAAVPWPAPPRPAPRFVGSSICPSGAGKSPSTTPNGDAAAVAARLAAPSRPKQLHQRCGGHGCGPTPSI